MAKLFNISAGRVQFGLKVCGCEYCPSFNFEPAECGQMGVKLKFNDYNRSYTIPDDCPLEDAEEAKENN